MTGMFPWPRCNGPSPSAQSGRSTIPGCSAIIWRSAPSSTSSRTSGRPSSATLSGPNTLGAEEVAEFIDSLESGGPPSAVRWLSDYLESIRAIYAIRIYPEAMLDHPDALDAVYAVRTALHDAVGGIGQWDGHGFTNEDDRLIWCDPRMELRGETRAAILDESTGEWIPFELDLDDPDELAAFLRGEIPEGRGVHPTPQPILITLRVPRDLDQIRAEPFER